MADQLYLSLWFPNFRLASLPAALAAVLKQFAQVSGVAGVHAAAVYPLSWNEAPLYQRVYGEDEANAATPERAVAATMGLLHDDYAYEFEAIWNLWSPDTGLGLDPLWRREPRAVRITGFGPEFDEGAYQQNGHIRLDLGTDTPFLEEDVAMDLSGAEKIRENVEMLVRLTAAIEEKCGVSSRLLWSESGENLAQKLIARLQRVN